MCLVSHVTLNISPVCSMYVGTHGINCVLCIINVLIKRENYVIYSLSLLPPISLLIAQCAALVGTLSQNRLSSQNLNLL